MLSKIFPANESLHSTLLCALLFINFAFAIVSAQEQKVTNDHSIGGGNNNKINDNRKFAESFNVNIENIVKQYFIINNKNAKQQDSILAIFNDSIKAFFNQKVSNIKQNLQQECESMKSNLQQTIDTLRDSLSEMLKKMSGKIDSIPQKNSGRYNFLTKYRKQEDGLKTEINISLKDCKNYYDSAEVAASIMQIVCNFNGSSYNKSKEEILRSLGPLLESVHLCSLLKKAGKLNILAGLDLSDCWFNDTLDDIDFSNCKFTRAKFGKTTSVRRTIFNNAYLEEAVGFDSVSNLEECSVNEFTKVQKGNKLYNKIFWKGVYNPEGFGAGIDFFCDSRFAQKKFTFIKISINAFRINVLASYNIVDSIFGDNSKNWIDDGVMVLKDNNGYWLVKHDSLAYNVFSMEYGWKWMAFGLKYKWFEKNVEFEGELGYLKSSEQTFLKHTAIRSLPGHQVYSDTVWIKSSVKSKESTIFSILISKYVPKKYLPKFCREYFQIGFGTGLWGIDKQIYLPAHGHINGHFPILSWINVGLDIKTRWNLRNFDWAGIGSGLNLIFCVK
jgi:hypothetical protein